MTRLRIAALGSSFAAGPSIEPLDNLPAQRSERNYAHQVASRLNADLTDLSVSGATLLNILHEPHTVRTGELFPPQLGSLPPDTNIVTLTAGGNDLGYSAGMIYDSVMADPDEEMRDVVEGLLQPPASTTTVVDDARQLTERFVAVIDGITAVAPKAKIYLVEYLAVFGPASRTGAGTPLAQEAIGRYREQARRLAQAYRDAARARPGVECVTVAEESEGHCVGSQSPWVTGFSMEMLVEGPVPYHPNLAGHEAVAELLLRRMQDDIGATK